MKSLAAKLTLAFLLVSLTAIGLVALLAGRATTDAFGNFLLTQNQLNLTQSLANYYAQQNSWQGLDMTVIPPGPGRGMITVADTTGRVVLAGPGFQMGQQLSRGAIANGAAITLNGQQVGTIVAGPGFGRNNPAGAIFLNRVYRSLVLVAIGVTLAAVLVSIILAQNIGGPLRQLTKASQAIAKGELGQQVTVNSQDEIGQLATAFNQMSRELAHSQQLRQQMTADIAHELRTPLSIILGHAEALQDGVLPPAPETFALIHDEASRLNRLVEELRTLTLAEAGELQLLSRPVPPQALLEKMIIAYTPRAQQQAITLRLDCPAGLPTLTIDPDRMAQVLANLLDNALRHTPAGGQITLAATHQPPHVSLSIRDTGIGIAPQDLPHIFNRFYRGEKSRNRQSGGSGLGLAIAKSIVQAHGGQIEARSDPGKGTIFTITLNAIPT